MACVRAVMTLWFGAKAAEKFSRERRRVF